VSGRIRVASRAARTIDGKTFDSMAEMKRYAELRMLERAGLIEDLELQPEYILLAPYIHKGKKVRAITYRADFRYLETRTNCRIVEDCKGMRTEVYKLKKKMLLAKYDIDFREVSA